jgi:hypothetical protein
MNPLSLMKTNTTRFLLPFIFNDEVTCSQIFKDIYVDSYTSDFYRPEHDGKIIIVKTINELPYDTINKPIQSYQRGTNYIFVYDTPDWWRDDVAFIMNSNYDLISEEANYKLMHFWENSDALETLLSPIPNIDKQIYKYNKFEEMYRVREDN